MSELDPGLLEVMLLAQQCLKEDVGRPEEAHLLAALTKAEEHVASGKKYVSFLFVLSTFFILFYLFLFTIFSFRLS